MRAACFAQYDFDVTRCAPWDLTGQRTRAGVFPPPPRPSTLSSKKVGA
jgi:hypothetical protein